MLIIIVGYTLDYCKKPTVSVTISFKCLHPIAKTLTLEKRKAMAL